MYDGSYVYMAAYGNGGEEQASGNELRVKGEEVLEQK